MSHAADASNWQRWAARYAPGAGSEHPVDAPRVVRTAPRVVSLPDGRQVTARVQANYYGEPPALRSARECLPDRRSQRRPSR